MKYYPFPVSPDVITGKENNPDLFIRTVFFEPGYSEESFHLHPNSFEFYIVLSGSLIFENGTLDRSKAISNSIIYFEANEQHRIVSVSQTSTILLIKKIGADKQLVS